MPLTVLVSGTHFGMVSWCPLGEMSNCSGVAFVVEPIFLVHVHHQQCQCRTCHLRSGWIVRPVNRLHQTMRFR